MNSPAVAPPRDIFALFDDSRSGIAGETLRSRLYTGFQQCIEYHPSQSLSAFFAAVENLLASGLHAIALFSYEFGYQLQHLCQHLPQPLQNGATPGKPLITFLCFSDCEFLSADGVGNWLDQRSEPASFALCRLSSGLSEREFTEAIGRIREYIAAGDTYQVNFSFPVDVEVLGNTFALYRALRQRQPVPFGALIGLPDGSQVLSLSPELFVSHDQGRLITKPMKGTAAATGDVAIDAQRAAALSASAKERAENLMIVDLLRNDLGRIARIGSVKVRDLFAVERFGPVLQMTSTIEARLREGITLEACIAALFPCGSITGAPKRRTMQIVQELEQRPRNLYTGAIGWFESPGEQGGVGDFMMSVPIRTLLLSPPTANDNRRGVMNVGAGIVHDSDAGAEYQECLLKASFLTSLEPSFELFETLHATQSGVRHLDRHLARLSASAAYFHFCFNESSIRTALSDACQQLAPGAHRLRASLSRDGKLRIDHRPLRPLNGIVRLLIAEQIMQSSDSFLAHKTTLRRAYDQAWQSAESQGAFDALFLNERGEITEGGRCNIFVRLGSQWFTPPLSCGLLPGVMRDVLLADQSLAASERTLTLSDLRDAQEIWVCNALRGPMKAEIEWQSASTLSG